MHSLNDVNGKENKKGKTVNSVVKNIRHKEYLNVLIKKINKTQHEKNSKQTA